MFLEENLEIYYVYSGRVIDICVYKCYNLANIFHLSLQYITKLVNDYSCWLICASPTPSPLAPTHECLSALFH